MAKKDGSQNHKGEYDWKTRGSLTEAKKIRLRKAQKKGSSKDLSTFFLTYPRQYSARQLLRIADKNHFRRLEAEWYQ